MELISSFLRDVFNLGPDFRVSLLQLYIFILVLILAYYMYIDSLRKFLSDFRSRYNSSKQVKTWPIASGIVIHSETTLGSMFSSVEDSSWEYIVQYQFTVNGTRYESYRVTYFDTNSGFKFQCDRVVHRYPSGTSVMVYYNPSNPNECCLEPNSFSSVVFTLVLSLVMMVIVHLILVIMTAVGLLFGNLLIQIISVVVWPFLMYLKIIFRRDEQNAK